MDDITTSNTNNNATSTIKPSSDFQPISLKPLANGVVLKHQQPLNNNNNVLVVVPNPIVVNYKECLKNHAATLGGHALDGCGEFMPSPSATPTDPTSLKCAACGCHRNFHRRDHYDDDSTNAVMEYQPQRRHRPPPPLSPTSLSPPPISSSAPPPPHMLLLGSQNKAQIIRSNPNPNNSNRKRFRTKFSQQQKEKMFGFAERVGWKIQKKDEEEIVNFCNQIGVDTSVLKVWMHNNKSTLGKRDNINNNSVNLTNNNNGREGENDEEKQHNSDDSTGGVNLVSNSSFSS